MIRGLVAGLQPDHVLETGTFTGDMAEAIGLQLAENGYGHLTTVELDARLAHASATRLQRLPVEVIQGDCIEEATLAAAAISAEQHGPFELVWFDDLEENAAAEFRAYRPMMRPGCIVAWHDTAPWWPTRSLIDELEGDRLIRSINLPTPTGITFAEVLP